MGEPISEVEERSTAMHEGTALRLVIDNGPVERPDPDEQRLEVWEIKQIVMRRLRNQYRRDRDSVEVPSWLS